MMSDKVVYHFGKSLHALEIVDESVQLKFGIDETPFMVNHVILAVPADEALKIARTLPVTAVDSRALEVLERCSRNNELRFCRKIYLDGTSHIGRMIFGKFHESSVVELDVSSVTGDITLLTCNSLEDTDCGAPISFYVHSRAREALIDDSLHTWLISWLDLTDGIDSNEIYCDEEIDFVKCFSQSKPCNTPLSPLRESGYLIISSKETSPNIMVCGDFASAGNCGTFTGALLSANKAAHAIAGTANRCANIVSS
jgi:hypothetical protein